MLAGLGLDTQGPLHHVVLLSKSHRLTLPWPYPRCVKLESHSGIYKWKSALIFLFLPVFSLTCAWLCVYKWSYLCESVSEIEESSSWPDAYVSDGLLSLNIFLQVLLWGTSVLTKFLILVFVQFEMSWELFSDLITINLIWGLGHLEKTSGGYVVHC